MISLGAIATKLPAPAGQPRRLRSEILAVLAELHAPAPISALLPRIDGTRHVSRLGAELRGLEREGLVVFTANGWERLPPGAKPARSANERQ